MKVNRGIRATIFAGMTSAMLMGSVAGQDVATCNLVPLELPLFGGTPVAMFATPGSVAAGDPLTDAQVEDVLQGYVACINTGDPQLVWAMFSPRWFSETFADSEEHYLPAFEQMLDREAAPTGVPLELVEVDDLQRAEDGRVTVTATFRSGQQQWTDQLTLVSVDGQWLIDEVEPTNPLADSDLGS